MNMWKTEDRISFCRDGSKDQMHLVRQSKHSIVVSLATCKQSPYETFSQCSQVFVSCAYTFQLCMTSIPMLSIMISAIHFYMCGPSPLPFNVSGCDHILILSVVAGRTLFSTWFSTFVWWKLLITVVRTEPKNGPSALPEPSAGQINPSQAHYRPRNMRQEK